MSVVVTAKDVLDFWFNELTPKDWWRKSNELDELIRQRFAATHAAASCAELSSWREQPLGRLAEIIVLDQFSRNMYRDLPAMFASDSLALVLAQEAVWCGADETLGLDQRKFMYMPFMHSESLAIHEVALKLFDVPGLEDNLKFEHRHRDIIIRFGRYPHRNKILSRESTGEELEFLSQPGSSF